MQAADGGLLYDRSVEVGPIRILRSSYQPMRAVEIGLGVLLGTIVGICAIDRGMSPGCIGQPRVVSEDASERVGSLKLQAARKPRAQSRLQRVITRVSILARLVTPPDGTRMMETRGLTSAEVFVVTHPLGSPQLLSAIGQVQRYYP